MKTIDRELGAKFIFLASRSAYRTSNAKSDFNEWIESSNE
jgi:hypothetical protein